MTPVKPERDDKTTGKSAKGPDSVTLPPIDAEPEEIVRALFQRPPLKKPNPKDTEHD